MTSTADIIRDKLAALAPTEFKLQDDSAMHAGHKGNSGGGHYHVLIRSAKFDGLPMLARHRMVYELLQEELHSTIHALSIRAIASNE